jgi:hypothetical protein
MGYDELEEFQYLWDGTDTWTLHVSYHSRVELKIAFNSEHPTVTEIIAVRKLLEEYRHMPVHQLKEKIGNSKVLSIGEYSTSEAEPITLNASKLGLSVMEKDSSRTEYLPYDQENQLALLIDNDELSEQIIKKMLEAGVPIVGHAEKAILPSTCQGYTSIYEPETPEAVALLSIQEQLDKGATTMSWGVMLQVLEGLTFPFYGGPFSSSRDIWELCRAEERLFNKWVNLATPDWLNVLVDLLALPASRLQPSSEDYDEHFCATFVWFLKAITARFPHKAPSLLTSRQSNSAIVVNIGEYLYNEVISEVTQHLTASE